MEKTSIAVSFKGGIMKVLATGGVDEVLAAYREAEKDDTLDFVGMLRKPMWYKRNTPARNKVRHAQALRDAELRDVADSREASVKAKAEAYVEAKSQREAKDEEASLQAERDRVQDELNQNLAQMEEKERAQRAASAEETARLAEESITEVSPSTEMEKRGKKGKKS